MAQFIGVNKLRRSGKNADDALTFFDLSVSDIRSAKQLEFIGEELISSTTSITWFCIDFRFDKGPVFPIDSWKDILHFLETNPHLKAVELDAYDDSPNSQAVSWLQAAIAKSKSIKKVNFIGELPGIPSSAEELLLDNIPSQDIASALPIEHSIQTLRLQYDGDYLPDVLKKLEQSSTIIPNLIIDDREKENWSPSLPYYLLSPKSGVQRLELRGIDFETQRAWGTQMDMLILGLASSPTTTSLVFRDCDISVSDLTKLHGALQNGALHIKHLSFTRALGQDVSGFALASFCQCQVLQSLGVETDLRQNDRNLNLTKDALQNCSLSSLSFCPHRLAEFGHSLKVAMAHNLTHLSLACTHFSEVDLDCLVGLVQNSNLINLSLIHWRGDAEKLVAKRIFTALGGEAQLQNLLLVDYEFKHLLMTSDPETYEDEIDHGIFDSLGNIKKLASLKLLIGDEFDDYLSHETDAALCTALAMNWSLENICIGYCWPDGEGTYWDWSNKPMTGAKCQSNLEGLTLRNKAKKDVFAMTQEAETKAMLMVKLESYWKLPDALSLAFWLLERMPDKFF